jgi:DNA-binding MarR family transcriptional regulator
VAVKPDGGVTATDAQRAWRLLSQVFLSRKYHFPQVAAAFGLTPGEMHALLTLDPEEPKAMRTLAEDWHCDASNVTWLVDRLEERRLVERRPDPSDRRVRAIAMTAAGLELRAEIEAKLFEPPPEFAALSAADAAALCRILQKVAPE